MAELVEVKLGKKWNEHKKGSIIKVDEIRAHWLESMGFLNEDKEIIAKDSFEKKSRK